MIAFAYQLGDSIRANLEAHERYIQPLEERRHAAVAVVLVESGASATTPIRLRRGIRHVVAAGRSA